MSVTMSKADGVTVFTLTSDPQSTWPPLCQIFKGLCCSPVCCSVSQHLRRIQSTSQSMLGTLQIMVGLLHVILGTILFSCVSIVWWRITGSGFPFWLGALFILFGIMCILSEKYPSPCLVILTVVLNLVGVVFAITAIALYIINHLPTMHVWYYCNRQNNDYWYERHTTPSSSPEENFLQEKCLEAQELALMLLKGVHGILIVLSVLELCVVISSVVLGIKALRSRGKEPNKSAEEPE